MNKFCRFWGNIYFFLITGKGKRRIDRMQITQRYLVNELLLLKYSEKSLSDLDLKLALDYLRETGDFCLIPYRMVREPIEATSGYDKENGMSYVIHGDKRLYFSSDVSEVQAKYAYISYMSSEGLTGKGAKERSPHQYQAEGFEVEEGDVLVDVGCAEALLAIDVVEKLERLYLIENEKKWVKPLRKTFEPYFDKTILINKAISDSDTGKTIRLETILSKEMDKTVFLKMDIEGGELKVLQDAEQYLSHTTQKLKIACCVYHRTSDAENIEALLRRCGFSVSYSEGYMLTDFLDDTMLPSFRKGVIRAVKNCI